MRDYISEEEFVNQNLTLWDRVRGNFFFVPVIILFLFIVIGLFSGGQSVDPGLARYVTLFFVVTFAISVGFRMSVTKKVERLKREHQNYLRNGK